MNKLIVLIFTLFLIFSCKEVQQTEKLNEKVDHLKLKNDSLKYENDSLIKLLNLENKESNYWFDEKYDGEKFISQGILKPTEFIENKLREQTELIPLKAVLGGEMHFGKIQILSGEWLIADYDDGHIRGKGIYKFDFKKKW